MLHQQKLAHAKVIRRTLTPWKPLDQQSTLGRMSLIRKNMCEYVIKYLLHLFHVVELWKRASQKRIFKNTRHFNPDNVQRRIPSDNIERSN